MDSYKHKRKRGHKHGEAMLSIDLYAYNSKINHWNPVLKIGLAMMLLFLCIASNNLYVAGLVILLSTYVTIGLGKMPAKEYALLLGIPVGFLIVGSIIIAFEVAETERGLAGFWLPFGYVHVTETSLSTVFHLWGKAFGGISAMFMMSLSTPSHEIFSVLRKLKVPDLVLELMNMIYRFVFVMLDTFVRMNNSAESRMGYADWKTSLQTFGNIASNLLVVSLKKASCYYDAMESRCYDGELLFWEEEKKITLEQLVFAGGMLSFLTAVWFLTKA